MEQILEKVIREKTILEIENKKLQKRLESQNSIQCVKKTQVLSGSKEKEVEVLRKKIAGKSAECLKLQTKILAIIGKYKQLKKQKELSRFIPLRFLTYIEKIGRARDPKKHTKMFEIHCGTNNRTLEFLEKKYNTMMKALIEKEGTQNHLTKKELTKILEILSKTPGNKPEELLEVMKKYLKGRLMRSDQMIMIFRLNVVSEIIQTRENDAKKILSFLAPLISDKKNQLGIYELCLVFSRYRNGDVAFFLSHLVEKDVGQDLHGKEKPKKEIQRQAKRKVHEKTLPTKSKKNPFDRKSQESLKSPNSKELKPRSQKKLFSIYDIIPQKNQHSNKSLVEKKKKEIEYQRGCQVLQNIEYVEGLSVEELDKKFPTMMKALVEKEEAESSTKESPEEVKKQ